MRPALLAAVALMGMVGAESPLGPEPYRRERRPVSNPEPEKSGRRARLAEMAERRRARLSPTPPSTGAEK